MDAQIESQKCNKKRIPAFGHSLFRTIGYVVLLAVALALVSFLFGWSSLETMPSYLQPYSYILLTVNPYLSYIHAIILFGFGYLVVNSASSLVYSYVIRITEHSTAATLRTITKIAGIGVLIALMASVFNVDPAAALTMGSFGGLVMGFATQTILTHVIAGIFLLISRPFNYGDIISVSGQTGVVKEIKLMHVVLETEDYENAILIPSGTIVTQIIKKKLPHVSMTPLPITITLNEPPTTYAKKGEVIIFKGKLVEEANGKPIGLKSVKLLDEDIGRDDVLATALTEADGSFEIQWVAKKTDWHDNTAEIYARFDGDGKYMCGKSKMYIVTIREK